MDCKFNFLVLTFLVPSLIKETISRQLCIMSGLIREVNSHVAPQAMRIFNTLLPAA